MNCRNLFCAILLSASVLAGGFCVLSAVPARSAGLEQAAGGANSQSPATPPPAKPTQDAATQPNTQAARPASVWVGAQMKSMSQRAEVYYQEVWGVSDLRVKAAESGQLIRFNYRVVDPQKAAALNDKKAEPQLIDSQGGVKLVVPQVEQVGLLRQSSTPKAGMNYWMAFSNPTLAVKRGHRVDVVIGSFRATSLIVE